MLLAEWWAFQTIILFHGWLGVDQLAAIYILFNIGLIMYMFPLGISYSSTSLVGNNLGANLPQRSRIYSKAILVFACLCVAILFSVLMIFKQQIIGFYSSKTEVLDVIAVAFPLWAIKVVTDCTQAAIGGMLRAMGYQTIAFIVSIACYWVVMIPLAYILGFVLDLGIFGIWIGTP
mmetsp:Transcript_36245/g.41788  ORF Transcript_36245/g.41788 Transcript_36245/m.41788 type:complete len:176 (-) Transcript_36245:17-544(-)